MADEKNEAPKARKVMVPTMGRIVIVKGLKVHATGSDEDPAVVNSVSEFPVVPPVLTSPKIINGVPQLPPPPTKPDAVVCYLSLTLFPEGMAPRSLRNVPFFQSKDEAVAFALTIPRSVNPDQNTAAYWPERV